MWKISLCKKPHQLHKKQGRTKLSNSTDRNVTSYRRYKGCNACYLSNRQCNFYDSVQVVLASNVTNPRYEPCKHVHQPVCNSRAAIRLRVANPREGDSTGEVCSAPNVLPRKCIVHTQRASVDGVVCSHHAHENVSLRIHMQVKALSFKCRCRCSHSFADEGIVIQLWVKACTLAHSKLEHHKPCASV